MIVSSSNRPFRKSLLAVQSGREVREPAAASPDCATVAPCSSRRAVHRPLDAELVCEVAIVVAPKLLLKGDGDFAAI